MLNFVDVYKRPLNNGDVVLVAYYGDSANTILNDTLSVIGATKVDISLAQRDENNVICYKVEDPVIIGLAKGFKFTEWRDRYTKVGALREGFGEHIRVHSNIIEILGRELKAGDFVLYDFKKTKANYGLVISSTQILTETGVIRKLNSALLIINLTQKEQVVRKVLMQKYQEMLKIKVSSRQLSSLQDVKTGEVYLTKDNKSIIIPVFNARYTLILKDSGASTTSTVTDDFYVQMSTTLSTTKELMKSLSDCKEINLSDVFKLLPTQNEDIADIFPLWDLTFVENALKASFYQYSDYVSILSQFYHMHKGSGKGQFADMIDMIKINKSHSLVMQIYASGYDLAKAKCVSSENVRLRVGASILGSINVPKDFCVYEDRLFKVIMHI